MSTIKKKDFVDRIARNTILGQDIVRFKDENSHENNYQSHGM